MINQEYTEQPFTCELFIPLHLNKRDSSSLAPVKRDHVHFVIILNHRSRWNQAYTAKIRQLWATASPVHSPSLIKTPTANRLAVMWQEIPTKYKKNVCFTAETNQHWTHLPKQIQKCRGGYRRRCFSHSAWVFLDAWLKYTEDLTERLLYLMQRLKRKNREGLPEGGKRDAATWSSLKELEVQHPGLGKV